MIITNTATVNYDYTLPDQTKVPAESVSNEVQTENLFDAVLRTKASDKAFMREGERATQTIVLTNNSAILLSEILLKDFMTEGGKYIDGTVTVNGVSQPVYDMKAGIPIPDLNPSEVATITYIIEAGAITPEKNILNDAAMTYSVIDPARGKADFAARTNLITIPVVKDNMSVVKSVDKNYANKGDELTYTSVVTNTGSLAQSNLVFKDAPPSGTAFIPDSVRIDGISKAGYDPAVGFPLKDLGEGESTTVVFSVTVN